VIKEDIEKIQDRLLLVLAERGIGETPSFGLGEKCIADNDTTPRIVFVPHGGPISVAKKNGGDGISNPGALWSRAVAISAHIWADSITAVEELANHLVAAIHFCCVGDYKVTGERWDTKGSTDEGAFCIVEFQLQMPFTREKLSTTRATFIGLTKHIEVQ
jgi:hypothetical protein